MKIVPQRILVLAPHTDDAELGCGGTLSRFLNDGAQAFVAAFSTAEESLPTGAKPGLLGEEFLSSMQQMGIPEGNTRVFGFPVRKFSYQRQELLEEIVSLRREIDPDLVLLPAGSDWHQDHHVVYEEGVRAFKERTVWAYELPWNQIDSRAQAFVTLEREHLDTKWKALQEYKTQLQLARPYFSWNFIEGIARVRGVQVNSEYAEAFEVIRVKW
jgi:N-acetylglucosamine malate deacetylase 1